MAYLSSAVALEGLEHGGGVEEELAQADDHQVLVALLQAQADTLAQAVSQSTRWTD